MKNRLNWLGVVAIRYEDQETGIWKLSPNKERFYKFSLL